MYKKNEHCSFFYCAVVSEGSNGGRAVSYRLVYDKNGNLISKTKEANSYYKGHDALIAVGTMKVETPEETTPETVASLPIGT